MSGCTECGRKGGCSGRKGEMFERIDRTLADLYPSRRFHERDEAQALGQGVSRAVAESLADALAVELQTQAFLVPGGPDELSDFLYLLCLGRSPSILEAREGTSPLALVVGEAPGTEGFMEELHLRVALSGLAPLAAVQQVALRMELTPTGAVVRESPRSGVFDPVLLPRFGRLVGTLARFGIVHIDFGEILDPPPDHDGSAFRALYGMDPTVANYLFLARPVSMDTITVIASSGGSGDGQDPSLPLRPAG